MTAMTGHWLWLADETDAHGLGIHAGNLIFMAAFVLAAIVVFIWWLKR